MRGGAEPGRHPSPLSHSMPYSVPLAYPRGVPGDALPRKHARATLPGRSPSPLHLPAPHSVTLTCSHDSSRPPARTHTRRMMQNQNRNRQLACGLAIIPTCVPLAQLDRASASGAEGRRFEPCRGHQQNRRPGACPPLACSALRRRCESSAPASTPPYSCSRWRCAASSRPLATKPPE